MRIGVRPVVLGLGRLVEEIPTFLDVCCHRKPLIKAVLNAKVLFGMVPHESIFGYSKLVSEVFRRDWSGWERTGMFWALIGRSQYGNLGSCGLILGHARPPLKHDSGCGV